MAQDLDNLLKTMMSSVSAVDGKDIDLPKASTGDLKGTALYTHIINGLLKQSSITQDQLVLIQTLLPHRY